MARVTITQVAERAGVSLASASRALNGGIASADTVAKVKRAARELGYVADAMAQSLKLGRTMQLAYAVADIGNPVYVEMMQAIQEVVSGAGYRLVVSSTGSADATVDVVEGLGRGYVDGMILAPLRRTPELVAALASSPVPITLLGRPGDGVDHDTVRADSQTAMRLVVDHVAALGRQRITFVNGPSDTTPGALRLAGFRDAVAAHDGLTTAITEAADFTIAAGHEAALTVLTATDRPDAIVAANDLIGIGVLRAAEDIGIRVPDDLVVTGVDDTELASVVRPGLTSVDLGARERGRAAAELLLARIAAPERAIHTVTVEPILSVRDSTGAASDTARPGSTTAGTARLSITTVDNTRRTRPDTEHSDTARSDTTEPDTVPINGERASR